MIDMESFRGKDGYIDFNAYHKAQADAGLICRTCYGYVPPLLKHYGTRQCRQCSYLEKSNEKAYHDDKIRCPKCRHIWEVDNGDNYNIMSDGDHGVSCPNCDHDFTINTMVSYTYVSPKLLEPDKEETV